MNFKEAERRASMYLQFLLYQPHFTYVSLILFLWIQVTILFFLVQYSFASIKFFSAVIDIYNAFLCYRPKIHIYILYIYMYIYNFFNCFIYIYNYIYIYIYNFFNCFFNQSREEICIYTGFYYYIIIFTGVLVCVCVYSNYYVGVTCFQPEELPLVFSCKVGLLVTNSLLCSSGNVSHLHF